MRSLICAFLFFFVAVAPALLNGQTSCVIRGRDCVAGSICWMPNPEGCYDFDLLPTMPGGRICQGACHSCTAGGTYRSCMPVNVNLKCFQNYGANALACGGFQQTQPCSTTTSYYPPEIFCAGGCAGTVVTTTSPCGQRDCALVP